MDDNQETKFYQDYLDNEDEELDRLNNGIWWEEIAIIAGVIAVALAAYYFFG